MVYSFVFSNELNSKLTYFLKEVMIYACLKKAENGTEEFMYQFFIQPASVKEKEVWITDLQDVNHIRNVLRMKKGEKISLCCEEKGKEYICSIEDMQSDIVKAVIVDINGESRELPVKIALFQGLPKNDKMELIIQKAVELGVAEIVPMATKRAVVKLDAKKAAKKVQRWNEIAKSAAKQSKRGMIPEVKSVMSFKEAVEYGKSMDMLLIPYEDAEGIVHSRQVVESVKGKKSLGIYIGPEGGFPEEEVSLAMEAGAEPITLGHRILRTETAGMALLSVLMFMLEEE